MLRLPAGLVLVQDKGLFGTAAGPVEPHVGLAGRSPVRFFQPLPLELLLQTAQRRVHDEFLRHDMGHRLRGSKAARAAPPTPSVQMQLEKGSIKE
ncbi:hypothetical protein BACCAP_02938 [Pseudoflavonifractor capillosus ATCC 29799]|uniref:Uncharacterized protein n=1 Tax=Pseudoflavonifractor capillosus ATCC 29799 TaxID=411467 RepID=A6NXJ1_9FIRM|nr:hypothetical protein BACCAP_02938 [Pseudoflavonifractor capillosus ATCC 29799]